MLQNYEFVLKKFRNILMKRGKSVKAEILLLKSMLKIKNQELKNPFYVLQKAVYNVTPVMYISVKRRGSRVFYIPEPIKKSKALFFGIKWILDSAFSRLERGFSNKLSAELIDASKGLGSAIKKKESIYKLIIDNRPFLKIKRK